ncbi:MAG: M28 family peptidase, partial [Acidobacteriota bacterium]|nr:M28 family peptidase [Acidobacteriota bacterium]
QRSGAAVRDLGRARLLREKGAVGLITIINREREDALAGKNLSFEPGQRLKFPDIDAADPTPPSAASQAEPPFINSIEVRHEEGRALLGVTETELAGLFEALEKKRTVGPKDLPGRTCDIAVLFDVRETSTPNVVAVLPGRDAKLRNEYVAIGSHHDHNPPRDGRVFPGADDNGSGAVAMLAIAKALMVERPKRSVIFVWHTAEERGLIGAYYFVQHCPVPVEKISANLNLDMITRNDPDGIYLIGSNKLSTELDRSIRSMNAKHIGLKLDYEYEDPRHADRFFFRSDQYPYIRYGIPGVWFFCGTTEDYHRETDVEEKADYRKMTRVTKLVYLVAMDIGNGPGLLKLDIHPEVTARGAHNMKVAWLTSPAAPKPNK